MNEVVIKKEDFSHIIKKKDVWIVYTKNNKHWICMIGGFVDGGEYITLYLATKGECDNYAKR